jgi:uncharacterized protein (DUF427 family)
MPRLIGIAMTPSIHRSCSQTARSRSYRPTTGRASLRGSSSRLVQEAGMSGTVHDVLMGALPELRHEPTAKRVRAVLDGATVVDTRRALLVWEPRRVVASWAVPEEDLTGAVGASTRAGLAGEDVGAAMPDLSRRPVLDPSVPFAAHTTDGVALDVEVGGRVLRAAGFRADDPDLTGYVVLDFAAFDEWWEEDTRNLGHPRDPFHRIDVLPSSRSLRLELDGTELAASDRPTLLFETLLPTRFYLRPDDVAVPLRPSPTTTTCAYKGVASYYSATVDGTELPDIAWTYADPLAEAAGVAGLVAFFDERIDVVLDGERRPRPVTPWSR